MPLYTSKDKLKSGVPLGGIGAGKIEIFPDGTLDYFTFLNNWSFPYRSKPDERPSMRSSACQGFCFALRTKNKGKIVSRALQTIPFGELKGVESIRYEGSFPFASLAYLDKQIPLTVTLEAFSPLIPKDQKNSALPAAVFLFKLKNPTGRPVEFSLLSVGKNIVGECEIGRYNVVKKNKELTGLTFKVRKPLPFDVTGGELTISVPNSAGKVSYFGEWNFLNRPWFQAPNALDIPFLEDWMKSGNLGNVNSRKEIEGGGCQYGGALSVSGTLKPGEEKIVPVFYSWHFPQHILGHRYENWFGNSFQSAQYLARYYDALYFKTRHWHGIINDSGLPAWLKDALLNNLYVLFSGSWWTKKGEFSLYEAPVICPLMGTLDVRYYGSIPLAILFPEFEKNEMMQFAKAQRKNGYVPHDLGRSRLDMPSNGTTYYFWKDLNPKFILLAYRDFLWMKDEKFLKEIYPAAKRAMEFEFSTDKNRDFLPDNEGADQTYDIWEFHGTNSYTSSIFLASLLAMEKMALQVSDRAYARKCREWFRKGSKNFEKELWNGSYFIAGKEKGKKYPSCIAGQLNGQWAAHLLGLGRIAESGKIRKAVASMIRLNGADSKHGVTNSVFANGKRDRSNDHSQNIWPGESYALAALAIEEGFVSEGLKIAEKTWKNFTQVQKNPWNQPDVIFPDNGAYGFGDYYMRNMVVWTLLCALAKKDSEAERVLEEIKNNG